MISYQSLLLSTIVLNEETCAANPTLLTPIQPKIQVLKSLYYASHCANKYANEKEKEKKTTIFTKYHGGATNDYERLFI